MADWSDEGKLLVSGMAWNTTEDMLKQYFENHGDVIHAVIKPDNVTDIYSDVSGCVVFSEPCVIDWILHHTHSLNGRPVQLKSAFHERATQNHRLKIHVGGLPKNKQIKIEDEVRKYFQEYGNIVQILFPHRNRQFCFITFSTVEAVDYVLQNSPHRLNKGTGTQLIDVNRALPRGHIYEDSSTSRFMQFPQQPPTSSAWNKVL